jgi:hypothetical protein
MHIMSHSLLTDSSDDCAGLEFPVSHSSADQAQPLPRKKNGGVSQRSGITKVLVGGFLLGALFFVMSPVNQSHGAVLDEVSASTAARERSLPKVNLFLSRSRPSPA